MVTKPELLEALIYAKVLIDGEWFEKAPKGCEPKTMYEIKELIWDVIQKATNTKQLEK